MVNRILAFSELLLKSINLVFISHALVKSTNINRASVRFGLTCQYFGQMLLKFLVLIHLKKNCINMEVEVWRLEQ